MQAQPSVFRARRGETSPADLGLIMDATQQAGDMKGAGAASSPHSCRGETSACRGRVLSLIPGTRIATCAPDRALRSLNGGLTAPYDALGTSWTAGQHRRKVMVSTRRRDTRSAGGSETLTLLTSSGPVKHRPREHPVGRTQRRRGRQIAGPPRQALFRRDKTRERYEKFWPK